MQTQKNELIARVRAAFPARRLDFGRAITDGLDGGAYKAHVTGKTWQELDRNYVSSRVDVLSFLDTHHLVDILPVYLEALVEEGTKTPVPDTLLLVLDRRPDSRFDELYDALADTQREVVVAVIEEFAASQTGQPGAAAREVSQRWKARITSGSSG